MAFIFKGTRYESVTKPLFAEIFYGERAIAEIRGMPRGSAVDVSQMTSTESMLVEVYWALKRAGAVKSFEDLVDGLLFESIEIIEPPKDAEKPAEPELILDPLDGAILTVPPAG